MHILMLSLTVAFVVCVLLLVAFGLFTKTALARRLEAIEPRRQPHLRRGDPRHV